MPIRGYCLLIALAVALAAAAPAPAQASAFVSAEGQTFRFGGRPYYFIGTNYWYGGLLGLEADKKRGVGRLRKELDFLRSNGVTNLRLMAGAEGSGMINGVVRVGPPLQPEKGVFDDRVLDGLDLILSEMGKRGMKAVIFLSNNWEWSGGFQQYLIWNEKVPDDKKTRRLSWDELRDVVAGFYTCDRCKADYLKQVEFVLGRRNRITGKRYIDDPTIMTWELANEPRPMRPAANDAYRQWVREAAAAIKARDSRHLVTIGHEGSIGTESLQLFEEIHRDRNVDYLTIHIWAKNWGWFTEGKMADEFPQVAEKASEYISQHIEVARRLKKPLVVEEFGLPRDGSSFDPLSTTTYRDEYFRTVFSFVGNGVAGANFWAFGGSARPVKGQPFWKPGDDRMGDPPMEEQGLNTVFDSDVSTWKVIKAAAYTLTRRR